MANWLTAKEVAEKLRKSTRHFRERIAIKPGFPGAFRPEGGRPLWREDEIDAWMEKSVESRRDVLHPRSVVNAEQ
jgi:predicted DNA-binding transcriptional regulator AlpA